MSLSSSILFHILLPLPNVATLTYYYGTKSINHKAHCDWHQKLINCRQIVFGMTVTLFLWKCHFFHECTFQVRKGRKWSWLFSEIFGSKVSWIKNGDYTRILPFLWYSDLHTNKSIVCTLSVIYFLSAPQRSWSALRNDFSSSSLSSSSLSSLSSLSPKGSKCPPSIFCC